MVGVGLGADVVHYDHSRAGFHSARDVLQRLAKVVAVAQGVYGYDRVHPRDGQLGVIERLLRRAKRRREVFVTLRAADLTTATEYGSSEDRRRYPVDTFCHLVASLLAAPHLHKIDQGRVEVAF